jgi:ATP/ADP translocase
LLQTAIFLNSLFTQFATKAASLPQSGRFAARFRAFYQGMSAAAFIHSFRRFGAAQSGKISLSWLFAMTAVLLLSATLVRQGAANGVVPLDVGLGAGVEVQRLPAHGFIADPFASRL